MQKTLPRTRSCFVCGNANPVGLNLTFETDGRQVTSNFLPRVEHVGFADTIHGGLVSTVLDEAMVWACGVTAGRFAYCAELTVRFRHPVRPRTRLQVVGELEEDRRGRLLLARAELRDPAGSGDALEKGAGLLRAAGFEPALQPGREGNLFHEDEDGVRRRLRWDGGSWRREDGSGAGAEELLAAPASLSANVAVRPVLQDSVLPTVAYVCGPGEAGYLAQLGPMYEHFGVGRPVLFPRLSATILDKRDAEAIEIDGAPAEAIFSVRASGAPGSVQAKRLARAWRAALPRGHLQERTSPWPWYAFRHGAALFDAVLDGAEPFEFKHMVLVPSR